MKRFEEQIKQKIQSQLQSNKSLKQQQSINNNTEGTHPSVNSAMSASNLAAKNINNS